MIGKQKYTPQAVLFTGLGDQLSQKHPLYLLSNAINWQLFDTEFAKHYSAKMGAPSKPIRLMVSLLILKHLRNLSDETLVEQWPENLYYQYFGGEQFFRPATPCSATELVEFRKRIGSDGMTLILKESISLNRDKDDDGFGHTISIDTTVQEKNITYPTDDKLYKKIIGKCVSIAKQEGILLTRTYGKELKKLGIQQRLKRRKNGFKLARKANKRVKTIAGRMTRDLERKLTPEGIARHSVKIELYKKVLNQQRQDKEKTYSLHEPEVRCYTKGKAHKKFEFGSKVSIALCQATGVIVGALNFTGTLHDSKTIPAVLDQVGELINGMPAEAFADRGYAGRASYGTTKIHTPKTSPTITIDQRNKHRKRAAIEPVIGHLKSGHRLNRNFLKGTTGDQINVLLAAAAMNFKRVMNLWKKEASISWKLLYSFIVNAYWNFIAQNLKPTF